jgi:hypothetical protein
VRVALNRTPWYLQLICVGRVLHFGRLWCDEVLQDIVTAPQFRAVLSAGKRAHRLWIYPPDGYLPDVQRELIIATRVLIAERAIRRGRGKRMH